MQAPSNFKVAFTSGTTTHLSWATTAADTLVLERGGSATGPFTVLKTLTASTTSYDDSGLTLSTQYWYRLHATLAAASSPFVTTTVAPPAIPTSPAAPTGVTLSQLTATTVHVSWTHAGTSVDGFVVERRPNYTGFEFAEAGHLASTARTFDDTCLLPGTPYVYRVTARNAAGSAQAMSAASSTSLAATAPTATPGNLHATAVGANAFRIDWNATCAGADRILVEVSQNNGAFASVLGTMQPYFMGDATWFVYAGLQPGVTYRLRVSAGNTVGFSAVSAPITVGPLTAPTVTAGTVGITADYDNTKVYSDIVPAISNTAYPSGELIAGCFWSFNYPLAMQDFNCYSAALHFPLSGTSVQGTSFSLTGKTIDRAVLSLAVASMEVDATTLQVSAILTPWSTTTLTGNTSLTLSATGALVQAAPAALGSYTVDVTAMVRAWAAGSLLNNGLLVEDANYVFPNASLIRTTFFFSTDTFGGNQQNRPTLWVDFH